MYFNMKKKYLFSFALLLAGATAANAQVIMSEDFSAEQTKSPTDVGYYEFINTQEGDEREVKDGALHFYNTDAFVCANETWQRAIKFRNLPIEENTSYRVTLKLMGSNTYYSLDDDAEVRTNARFALMQGGENLDMGFLAANGEQQFSDISRFQTPDEGKGYFTYTGMFYYTTDAAQKAWYAEQNPTKDELPATYFLTLNVYNPGDFYIDDIVVEKAAIQGVQFYNDVIKVNFGYAISTTILNGADRLLLPNDCVTVKLNGKQVNIPSYLIKAGDVIEIREKSKSLQRYKDILEVTGGRLVPEWMDVDIENFKGTVKNLPTREMIDVPVDEMLIVELYSK